MKTIFRLFFLLCVLVISSCKKDTKNPATAVLHDFSVIKSAAWRDNIGKEFEVEGILVDEGNGSAALYTNEQDYLINAITPEARFINLNVAGSNYKNLQEFFGYKIKLTGVLEATDDHSIIATSELTGDASQARLRVKPGVTKTSATQYFENPSASDLCSKFPSSCPSYIFGPVVANKYALLYSGGINKAQAAIRFWNDIGATYRMLMAKGFSPDNIVVVYKDGNPDHGYSSYDNILVNYPATAAGFQSAINQLKNRMTVRDTFVLAISNHGGGNNTYNSGASFSGANDTDNDDERNGINDMTDETISYYNENKNFTDDNLKNYINQLKFGCMIGLLAPCYSGGLIYDLRGPNRVLISSATEFQYSWGTPTIDIFFATLINSVGFESFTTDPFDLNKDGRRTLNETFLGMVAGTLQNKTNQQPQYCDDPSGTYTDHPSSTGYGSTIVW